MFSEMGGGHTMRQRTSEKFEQRNFFEANKLIVGLGAFVMGLAAYHGTWFLFILLVPFIALRIYGYYQRGTVVIVSNTHLKITEKGWEKKIRWDEISKPKAVKASVGGFAVDTVLKFKEGKKRHKIIVSELDNGEAFLQSFFMRAA